MTMQGAGLGLRRDLIEAWRQGREKQPDFIEITPENWMGLGGRFARDIAWFTERNTTLCHGLSLSIGGPEPLDTDFIDRLGAFMNQHRVTLYSEHLSYCSDEGHLYDLIPLPFTEAAVKHVSRRIREVQDRLERPVAMENISYYATPKGTMGEAEFINAVLTEADCPLLLDVNNVYVNAMNHGYDPGAFIDAMPTERIAYLHIAGHLRESDELLIDTHGDEVVDPVWALLAQTYARHGTLPTLLERDFNIPALDDLLDEVDLIRGIQDQHDGGAR